MPASIELPTRLRSSSRALRPRPSPLTHGRAALATRPGRMVEARRVIAKVEWHPGELHPRVGFIVTNPSRPAERGWPFYNKRGTAEQWTSLRASSGVIWGIPVQMLDLIH
jgi:hypothetical protein